MTITVTSTDKIVTLEPRALGELVQCRVWEGKTESGIPIHVFIPRVAVEEGLSPGDYQQFEVELLEQAKPSAAIVAIPLRLIL